MKLKNFILPLASVSLWHMNLPAQTFTTLHGFSDGDDGAWPSGSLVISGGTLYGTTSGATVSSASRYGNLFKVRTDGTGFSTLHIFTGGDDGGSPGNGLVLSGDKLYGTTLTGGSGGRGRVFKVNIDGTGFVSVYSFTNDASAYAPQSGLILSGNTLYGTLQMGAVPLTGGAIFKVNTDGTGFEVLHSFSEQFGGMLTNNDGALPYGRLAMSGNTLYGTCGQGGSMGWGTVFKVNTDGTGFSNIHSFTATDEDGGRPFAGLVLSGNTLYGTTSLGGTKSGYGTVFKVNVDGTGFTILHGFAAETDGSHPTGEVVVSGNTLYGTTSAGGIAYHGTLFRVNTDGSGFATLYNFGGTDDGSEPLSALVFEGNSLFGTAHGANSGYGSVFRLTLTQGPEVTLVKAVKPSFSFLSIGTNYQLQVSSDMNTWTNQGSSFTATNSSMVYPQYWDVDNWGKLFFRLQATP